MSRQIEIRHPSGVWVEWGVPGTPPEGSYPWRYVGGEEAMTDTKRIVAEETWEADGQMLFRAETDGERGVASFGMVQGDELVANQDARARIAACAPEALRMLLRLEWDAEGMCPVCAKTTDKERTHRPDCEFDALYRKAGLR